MTFGGTKDKEWPPKGASENEKGERDVFSRWNSNRRRRIGQPGISVWKGVMTRRERERKREKRKESGGDEG